jgi:hypothetical protein
MCSRSSPRPWARRRLATCRNHRVVDRVGNVLAVFRMNGARLADAYQPTHGNGRKSIRGRCAGLGHVRSHNGRNRQGDHCAYLSSSGNAFSTRTASAIVQEHFPPAPNTPGLEAGPLFGVQFSQLPCSDLNSRFTRAAETLGRLRLLVPSVRRWAWPLIPVAFRSTRTAWSLADRRHGRWRLRLRSTTSPTR